MLGYEETRVCSARRVLTDRAFLAEPKTMLWAFMLGGLVAGAFIILFGLLGVFGAAQAITHPSRHAPLQCQLEHWRACTVLASLACHDAVLLPELPMGP